MSERNDFIGEMTVDMQEINQLEAVVKSQNAIVDDAREQLRLAEKSMFLSDQKLNKFVDTIENSEVVLKAEAELDAER